MDIDQLVLMVEECNTQGAKVFDTIFLTFEKNGEGIEHFWMRCSCDACRRNAIASAKRLIFHLESKSQHLTQMH